MGLYLIGTAWYLDLAWWSAVLKVAIGLGMVIFVHELGHFVVAKLCGVKCEKFYLGFDIAGLKLAKFTWGETEYGIGILPLGGYVKMLGQEDNPARLREEIERAKQGQHANGNGQGESPPQDPSAETAEPPSESSTNSLAEPSGEEKIDVEAAEKALYDPRSYLAQSVPRRMAIISAGVIMNLVFAFVVAVIAFGLGVQRRKCVVGQLLPGDAAWQANLKVGDQIVEIAGQRIEKFRDMQTAVSLGDDLHDGIPIVVRRPGVEGPLTFTVMPDSSGLLPRIGIFSASTTTVSKREIVAAPGTVATRANPPFQLGDKVVKVDDAPIETHAQWHAYLAAHPEEPLQVTVQRKAKDGKSDAAAGDPQDVGGADDVSQSREVIVHVAASRMRRLGLVMQMGPICAIQADSPAAAAGLQPGDRIVGIDGRAPGDPMTLPDRLRRRAGQHVTLTVRRGSQKEPLQMEVTPRHVDGYETPIADDNPMTVPALGIAYRVSNRVDAVLEETPAAAAGLRAGDVVVEATLVPPEDEPTAESSVAQKEVDIELDDEHRNWPSFVYALQETLPGTQVQLKWLRQEAEHSATMASYEADDWFNPSRGLIFEPLYFVQTAKTVGEALSLGADETTNATLLVYRFLQKLGSQQVSPRALGGPIAIFTVAKHAAEQGTSDLLIFLTLLSANLAVINFLPIPLLDGGHMLLLTWELIRGKPADERVQMVLTYIGLAFILSLMAWVIGLDVGLISRH